MADLRAHRPSRRSSACCLFWAWLVVSSMLGCEGQEDSSYEDLADEEDFPVSEHEFPKEHIATRPNYTGPGHWASPPPHLAAKIGFVPMKIYAQVRHTNTVKHLPRSEALRSAVTAEEIANAPRLREVISSKKLGEVYTEEGYEDSAYDHADFEKKREHEEGYEHAEKKLARPRKGRRHEDSEYQGSDVDSKYAGTAGEAVRDVAGPPARPRVRLDVSRKENHVITMEDNTKRVYPSSLHTAYTYTVNQPLGRGAPPHSLRTHNYARSFFIEPDASGTSPVLIQYSPSSQTGDWTNHRDDLRMKSSVPVPATVLTPPKMLPDNPVSHTETDIPPLPTIIEELDGQLPSADGTVFKQYELPKGSANNFEKILLPQFFTNNVYDLYLGIKRNNNLVPGKLLNYTISNSNESKKSEVLPVQRISMEEQRKVNDTEAKWHEQYVSVLTMLQFGRNSTVTTESSAVPERANVSQFTENGLPKNVTTTSEATTVSELSDVEGIIKIRHSSAGRAAGAKDKRKPGRNRSAVRRGRTLRQRGKAASKKARPRSKSNPTMDSDASTESLHDVKPASLSSPFYKDLDVGMSEKKFLFAFDNIFQEPLESVKPITKDSNTMSKNVTKLLAVNKKEVFNNRPARGAGVTKLDNLKFRHISGGEKNATPGSKKQKEAKGKQDQPEALISAVPVTTTTTIKYDSTKYPFFASLPSNAISVNSPIRYALDLRTVPRKTEHGMEFYESRENVYCPEVSPKLDVIPKRKKDGEWNKSPIPKLPRLSGLGDKIDCLRAKYFGDDPLDNPFFSEPINSGSKQNSENMESISTFIENFKSLQNKNTVLKRI